MRRALRSYLAIEMTVAAAISAVLSVVFAFLLFGGRQLVPVVGAGGLVVDAIPQSAMIALMSTLVPTLLTRRRVAAGAVTPRPGRVRSPQRADVRALVAAIGAGAIGGLVHAALLPLGPAQWSFTAVLIYKPAYGALLGAAVAGWAIIEAIADPAAIGPAGSTAAIDQRVE